MKTNRLVNLSILIVFLIPHLGGLSAVQAAPGVIYVDIDAITGADDGTSWDDAYIDLQSAMASALPTDELWVAEGMYKPTSGTDRVASFQLLSNVALYGGFSGTEVNRDDRDWTAHLTVLSGDIGTAGLADDNSYHVVTGSDTDSSAVLDGFTITGGQADGTDLDGNGAGMVNENGSPTLINLIIRDNHALMQGGGMHNFQGDPTLMHVLFDTNSVISGRGGGMQNTKSNPVLVNVVFRSNSSPDYGGGMHNWTSNPTLVNVVFSGNHA
ncbi:MAG: hypothetical protein JRC99_10835, partial [Deltaproteobacteria bacterium]|nr:hypothetical protein [Deltaproteobacteria bacterium]